MGWKDRIRKVMRKKLFFFFYYIFYFPFLNLNGIQFFAKKGSDGRMIGY